MVLKYITHQSSIITGISTNWCDCQQKYIKTKKFPKTFGLLISMSRPANSLSSMADAGINLLNKRRHDRKHLSWVIKLQIYRNKLILQPSTNLGKTVHTGKDMETWAFKEFYRTNLLGFSATLCFEIESYFSSFRFLVSWHLLLVIMSLRGSVYDSCNCDIRIKTNVANTAFF